MTALSSQANSLDPLLCAPPEVRAELNRTYTQYRYLSGMASEMSLAVSISFFIQDHRASTDDANAALKACRSPEKMREFKFAADLMAEFARLICVYRERRQQFEAAEEARKYREENPNQYKRESYATHEEISKLCQSFTRGQS